MMVRLEKDDAWIVGRGPANAGSDGGGQRQGTRESHDDCMG